MNKNYIDLKDFIEKNFNGSEKEKTLIDLSNNNLSGITHKNGRTYLIPYRPKAEYFFHHGTFLGFEPIKFDNLANLRDGFFGNKSGYTYIATDTNVKPSRPLTDILLKIRGADLIQPMYRDPETFLKKYNYEYDRSFMVKGEIPKSAILEIYFPEQIRLIPELRWENNNVLDLNQYFDRIIKIRQQFKEQFQ
jgi:hypothetical protein